MKKLIAAVLLLAVVLVLSACTRPTPTLNGGGQNQPQTTVTRDRAIELALHTAGLAREQVYDLSAELERELLGSYWEVEFESGGVEYDYHIDAATEEIVKAEKHKD